MDPHDFLRERTQGVKHSGRDFYQHLKGTHDLLQKWGNPEHVCLAGLFHSIYGTQSFRHETVPLSQRSFIVDLIGPGAETLAWQFCANDRSQFFQPDFPNSGELLEIEAANLLEQGVLSPGMVSKLTQAPISSAAKAAISSIDTLRTEREFERCWPWLEKSLAEYGPTHGKLDVWKRIANNQAKLFPFDRCAILAEILRHPSKLVSLNLWLMGGDLDEIVNRVPVVEAWGRTQGCDRVIACGRRGWLKKLDGWRELGTRRAKPL